MWTRRILRVVLYLSRVTYILKVEFGSEVDGFEEKEVQLKAR